MSARNWQAEFLASDDPERTLFGHLEMLAAARTPAAPWRPGEPLRLLMAGYSGAGNVGTEMRTGEILRQLRHLLGDESVAFSVLSLSPALPDDVFRNTTCIRLGGGYIPEVTMAAVDRHHGTVACEGSMFKSTFANVLSGIMAGALGATAQAGKLAVGYGAEVARMDPILSDFVQRQVGDALIMCRNQASLDQACALGLRTMPGADTAWTFRASPPNASRALLRAAGWNGDDPVLCICPMNPFWWPVRPSPLLAREMQRSGAHRDRHFMSVFFHEASPEIETKYRTYLSGLTDAVAALAAERAAFPVIVAMDRVDRRACHDLQQRLGGQPPVIVGADHPVADLVAALRCADLLISSRFHALVAAMPAGVPSLGIAMDERIRNLLASPDETQRLIAADDPALGQRIVAAARDLDPAVVKQTSRETVACALAGMDAMGRQFIAEMQAALPEFPIPTRGDGPYAHLPPLSADIELALQ